jgi:hypothetical protein
MAANKAHGQGKQTKSKEHPMKHRQTRDLLLHALRQTRPDLSFHAKREGGKSYLDENETCFALMWRQGEWLHIIQLHTGTDYIVMFNREFVPRRKPRREPEPIKLIKTIYKDLDLLLERLAKILADQDPDLWL